MERGDPRKLFRKYRRKLLIPLIICLVILPIAWTRADEERIVWLIVAVADTIMVVAGCLLFFLIGLLAANDALVKYTEKKLRARLAAGPDDKTPSSGARIIVNAISGPIVLSACIAMIWIMRRSADEAERSLPLLPRWFVVFIVAGFGLQVVSFIVWLAILRRRMKRASQPNRHMSSDQNE